MPAAAVVIAVLAFLGAAWLLLHGLAMQFVMSPTTEQLARAAAGLEDSFRAWADAGSVAAEPTARPCSFAGLRRGHRAAAAVTRDGRGGLLAQVRLVPS